MSGKVKKRLSDLEIIQRVFIIVYHKAGKTMSMAWMDEDGKDHRVRWGDDDKRIVGSVTIIDSLILDLMVKVTGLRFRKVSENNLSIIYVRSDHAEDWQR